MGANTAPQLGSALIDGKRVMWRKRELPYKRGLGSWGERRDGLLDREGLRRISKDAN